MQQLGPDAQELVRQLHDLQPALRGVRDAAAAGLFPGISQSLDELDALLPQAQRIVFAIGNTLGDSLASGAESLTGPRWSEFFQFIETDVPPLLASMARAVGDLTHGLAEMWMAFDPLNDDFASWMERSATAFDRWASGLSETQGFQDFVSYVQKSGPLVGEALASIGNALVQILTAAAPLGGPVLKALSAVADAIAAIAGSDAGPAIMATVTALALLNRGMKAFDAASSSSWGRNISGAKGLDAQVTTMQKTMRRGAGGLAGLAVASSGVADKFGVANTASLALMGSLGGPWGAAVGGAVGLMMDLSSGNQEAAAAVADLKATLDQQSGAVTQNTQAWAANKLLDDGVLEAAESLGLSLADVTSAALGNEAALTRVNAALDEYGGTVSGSTAGRGAAVTGYNDQAAAASKVGDAISFLSGGLRDAQGEIKQTSEAMGGTADQFNKGASAADQFRQSVDRAFAFLDKRAALRAARDATRQLNEVLAEAPKKLRRGTAAYDQVQAALDEVARSSLTAAGNLKGMDRTRYLQRAKRDVMDTATQLLGSREAASKLANELFALDKIQVKPKVEVATDGVRAAVSQVASWLNTIPDEDVFVNVKRRAGSTPGFGPQLWAGGYTGPGGKYEPAGTVHRGEYVFSKEATTGNVAMLEQMHRQLRGYAQGGYVAAAQRGPSVNVASPRVSVGGARIQVLVDGREVRHVVRQEIDRDRAYRDGLNDRD